MSRPYSDDEMEPSEEGLSEIARQSGQTSVRRTIRSDSADRVRPAQERVQAQPPARGKAHAGMYDIDAIFDAQAEKPESYTSRLQGSEKRESARRGSRGRSASRAAAGMQVAADADADAYEHAAVGADEREAAGRDVRSASASRYERGSYGTRTARGASTARGNAGGGGDGGGGSYRRSAQPSQLRGQVQKTNRVKRIVLIAVIAIVLVAIAAVAGYCGMINNNLHEGIDDDLRAELVQTDMAKEPFYILLLGTDSSAEREESEEYGGGGFRSDTIILTRIDAPNKKATMVSIHRDTRTDMEEYGIQKMNAAHALGGAALAVEEVSEMAGVPISHYAEIDFDAFCSMVDALGGIEVDVPVEIDDYDAGGVLHAGLQTLNGDQALILCRSRHTYEGLVADADMMRAANQRLVLSAIARKVLDSDIGTIAKVVGEMSAYVKTDLDVNDIIGLAQSLQGLDPSTDIYSAMEPAEAVYEDDTWWTVTKEDEWRKMMQRVDAGLPPMEQGQIDEKTGTVIATAGGDFETTEKTCWISVKNGTPTEGLAMSAVSLLNDAGFMNATAETANSDDYTETLVVYDDPAQEYQAQQIVKALGQGRAMLNDGDWFYENDYLVIIGSDWNPNKGSGSSSKPSGSGGSNGSSSSSTKTSANASAAN